MTFFLITRFLSIAQHNWETMVEAIQAHIGSLNWGYRVALREKKVNYLNAFAEFIDPHTLKVRLLLLCIFEIFVFETMKIL